MSTAILERQSGVMSGAVVWLNSREAVIAQSVEDGAGILSIERGLVEPQASYLNRIVHQLGDRDRVIILGPGIMRLELERAYVSVYQRPDRLVDVEPSGPMEADDLLDRLTCLLGKPA